MQGNSRQGVQNSSRNLIQRPDWTVGEELRIVHGMAGSWVAYKLKMRFAYQTFRQKAQLPFLSGIFRFGYLHKFSGHVSAPTCKGARRRDIPGSVMWWMKCVQSSESHLLSLYLHLIPSSGISSPGSSHPGSCVCCVWWLLLWYLVSLIFS